LYLSVNAISVNTFLETYPYIYPLLSFPIKKYLI